MELLRNAAGTGYMNAQHTLAMMLRDGRGCPGPTHSAVGLPAGDSSGAEAGGDGGGGGNCDREALKWFLRAAKQGHAGAQQMAGAHYEDGRGAEASDARAFKWMRRAAEQGLAVAQASLARWAPFSHLPSFSSCLLSSSPRPPPPPHPLTFPLLEKFRDRGDYGGGCLDAWLLRGYSRWHCLVRLPGAGVGCRPALGCAPCAHWRTWATAGTTARDVASRETRSKLPNGRARPLPRATSPGEPTSAGDGQSEGLLDLGIMV